PSFWMSSLSGRLASTQAIVTVNLTASPLKFQAEGAATMFWWVPPVLLIPFALLMFYVVRGKGAGPRFDRVDEEIATLKKAIADLDARLRKFEGDIGPKISN